MELAKWSMTVCLSALPVTAFGQANSIAPPPAANYTSNARLLADGYEPSAPPASDARATGIVSTGQTQHSTRYGDHRAFGRISPSWSSDNPPTLAFRSNDYTTQGSREIDTPEPKPAQRTDQRVIPTSYAAEGQAEVIEEPPHQAVPYAPPPSWAQPAIPMHEGHAPVRSPHVIVEDHEDLAEFEHTGHIEEHHEVTEVHPGKWFVAAEYMFIRPRRPSLDFAISDQINDGRPTGDVLDLEYEASSAVRINFGYRIPDGHWQFDGAYTHFGSDDDELAVAPVGGTLFATTTSGTGGVSNVTTALAEADLDIDIIDVGISRYLHIAEHVQGRVYVGGRFAAVDQQFNVTYTGQTAGTGAQVTRPTDFYAGGLRVVGEARTELWHDFSVFGRAGVSLLAGQFDSEYREVRANNNVQADIQDDYEQFVPVTELALGFTYHYKFLDFTVGYEVTHWANAVDNIRLADDQSRGLITRDTADLVLSGLFARGLVEFGAKDTTHGYGGH